MDTPTRNALLASIEKWKANTKAQSPDDYHVTAWLCPLCVAFQNAQASCHGCPVSTATGHGDCVRTPFIWAWRCKHRWTAGISTVEVAHEAAQAEVVFLQSLVEAR